MIFVGPAVRVRPSFVQVFGRCGALVREVVALSPNADKRFTPGACVAVEASKLWESPIKGYEPRRLS
jgi:hypothetical protein